MYASIPAKGLANGFGSAMSTATELSDQTPVTSGGTNHNKGSWVQLESSTDYDSYGLYVGIWNAGMVASFSRGVIDIGIGGSGSETVLIPNILSSSLDLAGSYVGGGFMFLPIFIPRGSRISARCQMSVNSPRACNVAVMFNYTTGPLSVYTKCDALGITTSAATEGVTVTPGAGAYGSYVTIATTAREYKALLPIAGVVSGSPPYSFVSLAVGVSSSDIFRRAYGSSANKSINFQGTLLPFFAFIPSGTALQARMWSSNTAPYSVGFLGFY